MVAVEDRRPHCWSCKQLGHIAKFCPQKEQSATTNATATTTATTTIAAKQKEVPEKGQNYDQPKSDEGWKEIPRKKGKKGNLPKSAVSTSPSKEKTSNQDKPLDPTPATLESTPAAPEPAPVITVEPKSPTKPEVSAPAPLVKVPKKKKPAAEPEEIPMETIVNLNKRRRRSRTDQFRSVQGL